MSEQEPNIGPQDLIDRTVAYGYDRYGKVITYESKVLYVKDGIVHAGDAFIHQLSGAANVEILEDHAQIAGFVAGLEFAFVQEDNEGALNFTTPNNEVVALSVTDEDDHEIVLDGTALWPNGEAYDLVRYRIPKGGTVVAFSGMYISHRRDTDSIIVTRLIEDNLDFEAGGTFEIEPINTVEDAIEQILADFPWFKEELLYTREGTHVEFNPYIEDVVGDLREHGLGFMDQIRIAGVEHRSGRRLQRRTIGEQYYLACIDYVRLCQLAINMGIPYDENFRNEVFTLLADLEHAAQNNIDLMNRYLAQHYPHIPQEDRYFKSNRFFTPYEVADKKSGYHRGAHIGMDITIPTGRTEDEAFAALVYVDTHERHHIGSEERKNRHDGETFEEVLTAEMLTVLTDAIVDDDGQLSIDISLVTADDYRPAFLSVHFSAVRQVLRWVESAVERGANYEGMIRSLLFSARTGIFEAHREQIAGIPTATIDHSFVIDATQSWYDAPIFDALRHYYNMQQLREVFEEEMSDSFFRRGRKRRRRRESPVPDDPEPEPISEYDVLLGAINDRIQAQFN